MEELLRGRSTLIIAHRSEHRAARRPRAGARAGTIVEEGTHDELLARDGAYARLYRAGRELLTSE